MIDIYINAKGLKFCHYGDGDHCNDALGLLADIVCERPIADWQGRMLTRDEVAIVKQKAKQLLEDNTKKCA
jgi:hypothetical protein